MELKELQKQVNQVFMGNARRDKIKVSSDYLALKLSEELGEFVQSYLVHQKRCRPVKQLPTQQSKKMMAKELGDVLGLVLLMAKNLNIDVEEALLRKWVNREY